jgi:hypothetical protein
MPNDHLALLDHRYGCSGPTISFGKALKGKIELAAIDVGYRSAQSRAEKPDRDPSLSSATNRGA